MPLTRTGFTPAAGLHGLWLDGELLYCTADANAPVVLHRDTGAVHASLPLPGAPDVIMHDQAVGHLYVAIGEPGVIAVADTRNLEIIEQVPTEPGAHTPGIDPRAHVVCALLPASWGVAVFRDR